MYTQYTEACTKLPMRRERTDREDQAEEIHRLASLLIELDRLTFQSRYDKTTAQAEEMKEIANCGKLSFDQ